MSADITFHPIRREEIAYFVLDVLRDPGLIGPRAEALSRDPDKQHAIAGLYESLLAVDEDVRAGREEFGALSLGIAAIAGYLHPFWHARGAALSFLADLDPEAWGPSLASLATLDRGYWVEVRDPAPGRIRDAYAGGGWVPPERLVAVRRRLLDDDDPEGWVAEVFDDTALAAIEAALDYAVAEGCGLLEAADLVVPADDEVFSDRDNLRASWLDNIDDASNARLA